MSVIAMGRWGGHELSYSSDADAMFVVSDDSEEARKTAAEIVTDLGMPTAADPHFAETGTHKLEGDASKRALASS